MRIATVIPESLAVAASVLRIHAVEDGGSNVLFIRSAVFKVITDIAGGLDVADLDIVRGRIYYHSLYPLDMQRRRNGGARDVATDFLVVLFQKLLQRCVGGVDDRL